jgi:hypothetical protein
LDKFHRKGLFAPVQVELGTQHLAVKGWKMRGGAGQIAPSAGVWQAVAPTAGRPAIYRATFTAEPPGAVGAHPILRATFRDLSRGTMWLNGHNLGRYPEKIPLAGMYLPECWLVHGRNTLTVFDEEGRGPDRVKLYVETAASREVIRVSEACDPVTPLVLPTDSHHMDPAAANKGNLAYGCPARASSSESERPAGNATDGDPDTRWCASSAKAGEWLQVDLGAAKKLSGCEIQWEKEDTLYRYIVEGSADGRTWTMLSDQRHSQDKSQEQKMAFSGSEIRYVRVTVTGLEGDAWASICELKVFAGK